MQRRVISSSSAHTFRGRLLCLFCKWPPSRTYTTQLLATTNQHKLSTFLQDHAVNHSPLSIIFCGMYYITLHSSHYHHGIASPLPAPTSLSWCQLVKSIIDQPTKQIFISVTVRSGSVLAQPALPPRLYDVNHLEDRSSQPPLHTTC